MSKVEYPLAPGVEVVFHVVAISKDGTMISAAKEVTAIEMSATDGTAASKIMDAAVAVAAGFDEHWRKRREGGANG